MIFRPLHSGTAAADHFKDRQLALAGKHVRPTPDNEVLLRVLCPSGHSAGWAAGTPLGCLPSS